MAAELTVTCYSGPVEYSSRLNRTMFLRLTKMLRILWSSRRP